MPDECDANPQVSTTGIVVNGKVRICRVVLSVESISRVLTEKGVLSTRVGSGEAISEGAGDEMGGSGCRGGGGATTVEGWVPQGQARVGSRMNEGVTKAQGRVICHRHLLISWGESNLSLAVVQVLLEEGLVVCVEARVSTHPSLLGGPLAWGCYCCGRCWCQLGCWPGRTWPPSREGSCKVGHMKHWL